MFRNIDKFKLELMMDRDPELRKIIKQMLENHRLAMSTISHEMRNPLTLIYSSIQLIEARHPEVYDFPHWIEIENDIDFLIGFVEEIGSLGNSDYLRMDYFNMRHMLESMVLSFAFSVEGTGIEFTSRIDPSIGRFLGDKVRLQEVLINLLANAKQAILCQEKFVLKEKPGKIELIAYPIRGGLTIRVRDNGCGIQAEEMKTIFEPFVTYKENGTGLGLSISKKVAEAHQGSLTCQSIYKKGSTFVLELSEKKNKPRVHFN